MIHKEVEFTQKITVHGAMHVMMCHLCGRIAASASERNLLPKWTTCIGTVEVGDELPFNFSQRHGEQHHGTATVLDSYETVQKKAIEIFGDDVKINAIGNSYGYLVYECYSDSGSVDYSYFAIKKVS